MITVTLRLFIIAIFTLACATTAVAIDSFQKIPRQRPDNMNTSATWTGPALSVAYSSDESVVPLNKIHTWTLLVTGKDGSPVEDAEISISADMPEHLHGMTTEPRVSSGSGSGQYLVEGMNFHMPGWWEITLDISYGRSRNLVIFNLLIGEGDEIKDHNHMHHQMQMNTQSRTPR